MKKLILAVLCLFLGGLPAAADRGIIGAMSYDSPLGCAPDSIFNLISGTEINTLLSTSGGSNTRHGFLVTDDISYQMARAITNSNLWVAASNLSPVSFINSLQFVTASVPDEGGVYNPSLSTEKNQIFVVAVGTAATCGGNRCPHLYRFNSAPAATVSFLLNGYSIGAGETFSIFDGLHYFFVTNNSSGSSRILFKLDSGLSVVGTATIGNVFSELVDFNSSVWFVNQTTGPGLSFVNKESLSQTNIAVAGLSAGMNSNLAINTLTGAKYVVDGVTVKMISSSNVVVNSFGIGTETVGPRGLMMDEKAQKLYLVSDAIGNKRIRRINPDTFAIEQTLSVPTGNSAFSSAPDFIHKYLWISSVDTPSTIQRIQLCT